MAKRGKLTTAQEVVLLREQNRRLRVQGYATALSKVGQAFVKYGAFVLIAYFMRDPFLAWAGKTTVADININARGTLAAKGRVETAFEWGSSELTTLLALIFGAGGVIYGRREAKLRRHVIQRFHPYQERAERERDPRRSSSRLTSTGDTRPEDE